MKLLFSLLLLLALLLPACGDRKAQELFETAEFEELQNNQKHAAELYRRILSDYPESSVAAQAAERLKALGKESPAE